jgi:hypothetical protein
MEALATRKSFLAFRKEPRLFSSGLKRIATLALRKWVAILEAGVGMQVYALESGKL